MDGELLSLKWNNHRTTFYHVISGLRNKESYTDVTLACDGKFYPVHKLVLSTCSEYFSDIFDRTPCKNPVVVLKDIQCRDLEFLLDYMYIGEVNVRQNELSSLIKAAECLRVKGLAVPDEEPKKNASSANNSVPQSSSNSSSRQRSEHSSPPAKRRRGEDRRVTPIATEHSPGRPPGDELREGRLSHPPDTGKRSNHSDNIQDDISEETPIIIKEEKQDSHDLLNVQNSYDAGGDDNGEGPHDPDGSASDFPEFLQSSIEKEEPVAISDFNPDYPGPSGLQNSGLAPWESENTSGGFSESLSGAVAAAVAASTQPQQQQQQQQQQLMKHEGSNTAQSRRASQSFVMCDICKLPVGKELLGEHRKIHICGWLHVCPQCEYKTHRSHDLKRHLHSRHEGALQRPYRCTFCRYRTAYAVHLERHITEKHLHLDN